MSIQAFQLFGRAWKLVLEPEATRGTGWDVSNLDIEFHVKKTILPKPNTASISVFNLGPFLRERLSSSTVKVRLDVGYGDNLATIYLGEVRAAYHDLSTRPNVITHLETGDSEKAIQTARIRTTFPPGKPNSQVLRELAGTFAGVGLGNIQEVEEHLDEQDPIYPDGAGVAGTGPEALDDFAESTGIEYSIQDGAFQFRKAGKPVTRPDALTYRLSSDSGLIGSPKVDYKNKELIVEATTFILPGLAPGLPIKLDADNIKGGFMIRDVEYVGESRGKMWNAKLVLRQY